MTRRNVDPTKYRKQFHFRKCKFPEGVYSSNTFLYLKFLLLWIAIMVADYMLEFRFEYLWPFWLVIRSLNDSFKYQGIVFSVFFALIVSLSDLLFYMFLPVQWLFFAASTYVWVQYVWHTEKGVCLSTISLWLLFVYIEASVRIKGMKSVELCRPFAAHCIGFPIVTLAFGFKNYLSYKLRLKRQREIQKSNEFHLELISKALPLELQLKDKKKFKALNYEEVSSQQLCDSQAAQGAQPTATSAASNAFYQKDSKASSKTTSNEDLPYIQQKDMAKPYKGSKYSLNADDAAGTKASFFGYKGSGKSQQQQQNSSSNETINLSSFSISSLAYSSDQQGGATASSSLGQANLLLLPTKVDKNGGEHHQHHHRSSSSSSATNSTSSNSSSTTTAFLPSNPNNHTNININMTINATTIAAATATATANNGSQVSPSTGGSKGSPVVAASSGKASTETSGVVSASSSSGKKYKNKESHRANSASSGSPNESNLQRQSSNPTAGSDYKDELILRLEEDLKKLRVEIDQQKKVEQYLRTQINYITKCDRTEKLKLEKLQQENETLQAKISKMATQKQKEKDELDKKYQEEKKARFALESQLAQEKKQREELERLVPALANGKPAGRQGAGSQQAAASSPPPAYASVVSNTSSQENGVKECQGELCRKRLREYENEMKALSDECRKKQERILMLECEMKTTIKYRDTENKVDTLMAAVKLMESKNASLQESLSAETRFKMDLFSALGETRRQLDSVLVQLENKERELVQLNDAFKCIFKSVTNGATINMITNSLGNTAAATSNSSVAEPSSSIAPTSPSPQQQQQQHLPGVDISFLNSGASSLPPAPTSSTPPGTISSTINGTNNKVSNGGIN